MVKEHETLLVLVDSAIELMYQESEYARILGYSDPKSDLYPLYKKLKHELEKVRIDEVEINKLVDQIVRNNSIEQNNT